jgi:hypothetical protein
MAIDGPWQTIKAIVDVAIRFVGQPRCFRVIFPAASVSLLVLSALMVGYIPLWPINLAGGDLSLGSDGVLSHVVILFLIAILVFWIANYFFYGALLRFILVWMQVYGRSQRKHLEVILNFLETGLRGKVEDRRTINRAKHELLDSNYTRLSKESERLASAYWFRRWPVSFKLGRAREKLDQFKELQRSMTRADDGARALNRVARARQYLLELVGDLKDIDNSDVDASKPERDSKNYSEEKSSSDAEKTDWQKEIEIAAKLNSVVNKLRYWRKILVSSLFVMEGLWSHFTDADLDQIENSAGYHEFAKTPTESKYLSLQELVNPTELVGQITLAQWITSESSEKYWADRYAQIKPLVRLPPPLRAMIAAVDRLRNKTVMYAALVMALVLSGPCLILGGRLLLEQLIGLWFVLAICLQLLIVIPYRWTIWMALLVAIRERQITRCL